MVFLFIDDILNYLFKMENDKIIKGKEGVRVVAFLTSMVVFYYFSYYTFYHMGAYKTKVYLGMVLLTTFIFSILCYIKGYPNIGEALLVTAFISLILTMFMWITHGYKEGEE